MTATARIRPLTAFLAAAVLVGACTGTGSQGTVAPPPSTSAPSVEPASPDPTANPETPSPSAPSPTASAAPSATPASGDTTIVRAYFFLGSFTGNEGLVPVLREIPKTQAVATAAMNALIAGPSEREMAGRPAMFTTVPDGTRLLGLSIENRIATVNLSREFEEGGGSASVLGRLAQVTYTLTQFPTVNAVRFQLDGEDVTIFSGEGVMLDAPVTRDEYTGQLPGIFVDRPAWGAALGNPGRVAGRANVFEAVLQVAILDGAGRTLVDEMTMAECGTGCWGDFDVTLGYTLAKAQWGTLRVYSQSPKDGTDINVTEYPVWLTPKA